MVAVLAVIVLGNLARSGATPSTNSSNQATSSTKKVATGKSLIVYFSRTKGVYGGDVKVGHTAQVAQDIQKYTGADMYEIVPKVDYSSNYEQVTKQRLMKTPGRRLKTRSRTLASTTRFTLGRQFGGASTR